MPPRDGQEVAPPHVAAIEELAAGGPVAAGAPTGLDIPGRGRQEQILRAVAYTILFALALVYFVPFFWTVATSLKSEAEALQGFKLLPDNPSLHAYREVLTRDDLPFPTFFRNSLFLAATIAALEVTFCSLGGYAFARLRFPGREILFLLVLATLMIPDQLGLAQFVTQYQANWPAMMAAATMAILPVVIIYVFFQRYFVAGITAAGVK